VGVALKRGPELAEKMAGAKALIARRRLDPPA
jgi:RpiR family carbohydrate utilization transcriptional regulator